MSYVNNIRMFVRVYDLGSMSAAARDQRTSPAVASARKAFKTWSKLSGFERAKHLYALARHIQKRERFLSVL